MLLRVAKQRAETVGQMESCLRHRVSLRGELLRRSDSASCFFCMRFSLEKYGYSNVKVGKIRRSEMKAEFDLDPLSKH